MSPNKPISVRSPSPFRNTSPSASVPEVKIDGRVVQGSDALSTFKARATRESNEYLDRVQDDNSTFHTYINWIYTKNLATKGPGEWIRLCRLFILAEKVGEVEAKNAIIDAMHGFLRDSMSLEHSKVVKNFDFVKETEKGEPLKEAQSTTTRDMKTIEPQIHASPESIKELYQETPESSQVRKLVTDLYADNGSEDWLKSGKAILPPEFLYDVAASLMRKRLSGVFNPLFLMSQPSLYYHELSNASSGSGLRVP